ncbi:MAG: DUF29 family protein [Candidatus Binataceae bacterium]
MADERQKTPASEYPILRAANPGLKSRTADLFTKAWRYGRNEAIGTLGLDEGAIPEEQLWTFEHAVNEKFDPERVRNSRR